MKHLFFDRSRRDALKVTGGMLGIAAVGPLLGGLPRTAQANWARLPADNLPPQETFETTLKRVFGDRAIAYDAAKIRLEAPNVAENGAVVPVVAEATFPTDATRYVQRIYFLVEKNKRPLAMTFAYTPDTGMGKAATNLRLGSSSWVHAVYEMNDRSLLGAKSQVKVVVGGCGG